MAAIAVGEREEWAASRRMKPAPLQTADRGTHTVRAWDDPPALCAAVNPFPSMGRSASPLRWFSAPPV